MKKGVKHSKILNYAITISILITSLAILFRQNIGEIILFPGILIHQILQVFFMIINTNDNWYTVPSHTYIFFNGLFYAGFIYAVLVCIKKNKI